MVDSSRMPGLWDGFSRRMGAAAAIQDNGEQDA
jgi:hypothetical protein